MKKLKLRSSNPKAIYLEMWDKMMEGWKVVKLPTKNFFGIWICKLEKKDDEK